MHAEPFYTTAATYLHRNHLEQKQQIDRAVASCEPEERRARRHQNCGSFVVLEQSTANGQMRLRGNFCEYRTCPHCARGRAAQLAARFEAYIGKPKRNEWRFLTLTLSHSDAPLRDQLKHLRESFRRLRRHKVWKESQIYGRGVIEVTYNSKTRRWHPHLHVLSRGNFIKQSHLSAAWKIASEGSYIVSVERIDSTSKASRYVSKYCGKPPELLDEGDAGGLMSEYYMAVRNSKMVIAFGDGPPLPRYEDIEKPAQGEDEWVVIGNLHDILKKANAGDEHAQKLLRHLEGSRDPATDVAQRDPPDI